MERASRVYPCVVAEALVWMPVTQLLLSRVGYQRTSSLAAWAARLGPRARRELDVDKLTHSVDVVARRYAPERTCLARAVVLSSLLRRRGYTAEVHVGARRESHGLNAHAWVVVDGVVLGDERGDHAHVGVLRPSRRG